jgi:Fe-S cluster assembly iron-binding protein IscA
LSAALRRHEKYVHIDRQPQEQWCLSFLVEADVRLEIGGESMVTVTEQAAQELRTILSDTATKPEQTLRLVMRPGGGLGLGLDQEREGDQVVTAEGEKVLVLAPSVAETLADATITTQETEEGRKLVISRQ